MPGSRPWAVIAGGGTAGHVVPALATARALVARGHPPSSIHFVGSRRGPEAELVPREGFSVTLLGGRGIQRRFAVANVIAVAGLVWALVKAIVLIGRWRPAVVLSVGGYASAPCAIAAVLWRIPLVLHDQNARPGAANRLVARFARAAAVSFDGTRLPRATLTGNPVRPEMLAVDRSDTGRSRARTDLGLPIAGAVVAAFGGSLGARRINEAVRELVDRWSDRNGTAIHHVVGSRDYETFSAHLPSPPDGGLVYRAVRYEDRMHVLFGAADVAVCRAGGSTVAELAAAGLPAVLVPLPIAAEDHQTANARTLVDAGGAVLVPDAELTGARLEAELDALLADPVRLPAMGEAARTVARPDAAVRVADLLELHARRRQ